MDAFSLVLPHKKKKRTGRVNAEEGMLNFFFSKKLQAHCELFSLFFYILLKKIQLQTPRNLLKNTIQIIKIHM